MASIDKLALTCRLLYDQRVLEQRKEIEQLQVKLFFRDYTPKVIHEAMQGLNFWNRKCKCRGCKLSGRIICDKADKEAVCTFAPWFDTILKECGLVTLRKLDSEGQLYVTGPYLDENDKNSGRFAEAFDFSDEDCHLVEIPHVLDNGNDDPHTRWGRILIGKRLWDVESVNDQGIIHFEKLFGKGWKLLSSRQMPPSIQKVAPIPQLLPITKVINQGLELQALKEQLAAQATETLVLKEKLGKQEAETLTLKKQLATEASKTLK
jgi:hypothetical protein